MKVGGTLRSHISSGGAVRTLAHPVPRNDRSGGIGREPERSEESPRRAEFETGEEQDFITHRMIWKTLTKGNHRQNCTRTTT